MELKVPEILAPVGGRDAFFAALNSGADAVFLGLKQFNARARAENFTIENLRELVPLAHRFGMKVLVTLNILIKDTELEDLIDVLGDLEDLEVDALIVQDLGVASIVKTHFPSLRLHASTQMAVHNAAGVQQALNIGFKRVVLARELTALEIKKIRSTLGPEVEIEAFCHGSLCYSYSGLCFFSGAEDARSGNRGECAYTCRKPYKVLNEPGHGFLFSMKDLNTVEDLHLLVEAGVDTLKIEGRKKDAQYVTTAVKLYRNRLNEIFGRDTLRPDAPNEARELGPSTQIEEDLSWSFHRGMTSLFLKGRYHENVIDLDNPTHKGMRVGEVVKVGPQSIRVVVEKQIERFDGLRIDPQESLYHALPQHGTTYRAQDEKMAERYQNEVMQFSLRDLTVHSRTVVRAMPGELVEIVIPSNFSPKVGDVLTKVRSADLKRRVDALLQVPAGAKMNSIRYVNTTVSLTELEHQILLSLTVKKCGEVLLTREAAFEKQQAKKSTTNHDDLVDLFYIFGNVGIVSRTCDVSAVEGWFLPRSLLKEFKRAVSDDLTIAYDARLPEKKRTAKQAIRLDVKDIQPKSGALRFSVKIDRLEYLEAVAAAKHVSELVFEPKRAFLESLNGEDIARQLANFSKDTGISVRIALPTVIRAWDEPLLKRWLKAAVDAGIDAIEVGNLGAFDLLDSWNLPKTDLSSDFFLYALNAQATRYLGQTGIGKVALSIEDDHTNMQHQLKNWSSQGILPQVILFKDTPLFIAESCSLTALHNGCPTAAVCGYRTLEIENEEGERFYVAHESCKSIVYGKNAFSLSHRLSDFVSWGVRDFRIDFLTRPYTFEQIVHTIASCTQGVGIPQTHAAHFASALL